jgi:DNA-binding XRE family transcriptional regulator
MSGTVRHPRRPDQPMILSTHQLEVTRDRIESFLPSASASVPEGDILARAARDSAASMVETLRGQAAQYEALCGGREPLSAEGPDAFGVVLSKARISKGVTQSEAAAALGLSEMQFARYEREQFQPAPFHVMMALAMHLGISVRVDASPLTDPADGPERIDLRASVSGSQA